MPVTKTYAPPQGLDMGRKKLPAGDLHKQVNIRFPDAMYGRIEDIARTLGIDITNFLRMVISENLQEYEDRADRIRRKPGRDS